MFKVWASPFFSMKNNATLKIMKNNTTANGFLASLFLAVAMLVPNSLWAGDGNKKQSALMQYEDKITQIISQMTIEEKVAMLHGKHMFSSEGVPRLGIADIEYADGPFGIREEMEHHSWKSIGLSTDSATFFPTGSALAATWSRDYAYLYGKGMAIEARLRGKDMILGPAINIQRIPTGGRTYEYMSEDPLLSGELAVGYTLGVQDNNAAVCLKHYAVNNQENYRGFVDARLSERALHEIYLKPFEMAVREADAYGVMAAYNKVNGYWCSENYELENKILRQTWGFKGIVISDWGGTHSTVGAVTAGLNVEMPGQRYLGQALLDSLKSGAVSESVIDERVRELLRVRYAIKPVPANQANKVMASQPEQQQIAYEVAKRAVVLLKNDKKQLPLNLKKIKQIAVIGENAVEPQAEGGVGAGVKTLYEITPLQGIKNRVGNRAVVKYAQGYKDFTKEEKRSGVSPYCEPDPQMMAEAVALAKESDVVIFVAGNNREIESEGSDRTTIALPAGQDKLLARIAEVNPNIVTVVVTGAPADLKEVNKLSPAVLVSWFNGSEGGNALADILLGSVSPSGKLPFTFPVNLEDNPAYKLGVYPQQLEGEKDDVFVNLVNKDQRKRGERHLEADYKEDILVGYRWYDTRNVPVLYPFGHGLSYAAFKYGKPSVASTADGISVSFTVKNTGKQDAEEVVQVYAARKDSKVERPKKELKSFQRIAVKAGATENVELTLPRSVFSHWDEQSHDWAVEPGAITLLIGSSSQDIRQAIDAEVK